MMRFRSRGLASAAGVLSFLCSVAVLSQDSSSPAEVAGRSGKKKGDSIYTVSKYDPKRDATKDLAATVQRAKAEGKHIILEIGGDW